MIAFKAHRLEWRARLPGLSRFILGQCLCCCLGLTPSPLWAKSPVPAPPQVSAQSWCLVINRSDQRLGDVHGDKLFEPSSLSKLMTLFLVFEALHKGDLALTQFLEVDEAAWRTPGSRMYLKLGSRVRIDELIYGIVMYNANDAAMVLAQRIESSIAKFVERMNLTASLMEMPRTVYTHPAGLQDPRSSTTACEQVRLLRYLRRKYPQYLHFFSANYYSFAGRIRNNPNSLLRDLEGAIGMISVQTNDRRFHNSVATRREGLEFNFVMIGAGSRANGLRMSASIINHFYNHYKRVVVFQAREPLHKIPVWYGVENEIMLAPLEEVSVVIPFNQEGKLDIIVSAQNYIEAPVRRGKKVGQIRIMYENNLLSDQPMIALRDVKQTHWWGTIWDDLLRLFK